MAQSQPYLGGYVLLCGWYKRVMGKAMTKVPTSTDRTKNETNPTFQRFF